MSVIKLKRSDTAGNIPPSLEHGEVGVNIPDKKIYIGNSSGATTLLIDGNATGSGGVSSFNTRTGAVTLSSSDVTTALGYTPLSSGSTEIIQDAAASLFTAGTHTGISVSYPDTNNAINLINTGVLSFNNRTGSVSLISSDVTTALGYTPQQYDADLDAIAALSGTSGVLNKTAADTWSLDTDTYWKNTNDGNNSGLDADLIHGIDGTYVISNLATGLLYGGIVTINGSNAARFDLTAGKGVIHSAGASHTAEPNPTTTDVTWAAQTGVVVTNIASQDTTWLYIDSAGVLHQQGTYYTDTQIENNIVIGALIHPNRSTITLARTIPNVAYSTDKQYEQFIRSFGPLKVSGHQISVNGANLKLNRSSGTAFILGRNYINDAENPSIVSDAAKTDCTFYRYYRGASAGSFVTVINQTAIDPDYYDDGSGTLNTVPSNKPYTIQRLFFYPNTPDVLGVYYGRGIYASVSEAKLNLDLEDFTEIENTRTNAVFAGWLIIKKGTTDITSAIAAGDALIIQGGSFRSTTSGGGTVATSLDNLLDVVITSPAANQLLYYNNTSSLWVNASASTIGLVTLTGSETLTNKTISGASNTLSNIGNSSLTNSSITVNGTSISLGSTGTITANTTNALTIGTGLSGTSFNGSSAVTIAIDSTVATLSGSQTLTNKTISGASNTLSNIGNSSLTNSSITVNGTSISLGGSATVTATATNALTLGTGLTGTSYNGSTAITAAVDTTTIATRSYVDSVAQGLHAHATATTATTAKLATLTGATVSYGSGNQAITWTGGTAATAAGFCDGTTLTASTTESSASKILVKNEGDAGGLGSSKNGTYYVYGTRELRRTSDGNTAADWAGGDFCFVTEGTSYNNTGWVQTEVVTTLDTDPILWEQFSGAGTYTADESTLTKTGSVFSIKSTYTGQTSITTLGTIGTGTWNATTIGTTKGGTGLTSFTSGGLVYASSTSALTTGTVFNILNTTNLSRINIAAGASPKESQEFKVSETLYNSSAAIGVYTDVAINPPGSLGSAYINLISTTGTDSQIVLTSGSGSVTFAGGTTPLSLTAIPSLWGFGVGVLYCYDDAANPYIIFGDDGTFNGTNITLTDTSSTMVVTAATLKINTSTPSAGEVLTCTASDGTCVWQEVTGATLALYNMGLI